MYSGPVSVIDCLCPGYQLMSATVTVVNGQNILSDCYNIQVAKLVIHVDILNADARVPMQESVEYMKVDDKMM